VILEALVKGSLQSNFLDDAYRWGTHWVEVCPEDCQAHWLRGRVLQSGLRYDLAAEEYQLALERKPDLLAARLGLGEMLLRAGRFAEALPHFQAYLAATSTASPAGSGRAVALLGLAQCQRHLSPPEVALATLDQLLAGGEPNGTAFLLRGQLELERGNTDLGLAWLQRAEPLLPPDVDIYQALATASRLLNHNDAAQAYESKRQQIERDMRRMEDLTKQIIESPRDAALRFEAGSTLLRLRQEEQAARWLVSALLIDPRHEPTKEALAVCLPKLGDPKLVERYRRVLERN
jgi:tetratricopeptide (TPR) repeat protein